MGTAYTPGLTVTPDTVVRKARRLPLKGEVRVAVGQAVEPETVVAQTLIPGVLRTVKVAEHLGLEPAEALAVLQVREGDVVERNQLIAETKSFFGLFKSASRCPIGGTVELVSSVSGHVGIREAPAPVQVRAYVRGSVAEVMPEEGVVVETRGALVQGIFGVGGERQGVLHVAVESPSDPLTEAHVGEDAAGKIVVGGSNVSAAALRRAAETGVAAIIVGAIVDQDLIAFLGYDIGVAITGHETIPFTLVITEGFGEIPMARRTFALLKELSGQRASINGATQIRAGVIRPELIVPREHPTGAAAAARDGHELAIGTPIRLIREPHFGQLATVSELPPEPQTIPSGATVRVLEATLTSGEHVTVPRANVEIIATD
jgi:hypothetical protein